MSQRFLLVALAAGVAWTVVARAAEHTVVIDGVKFEPEATTVQRGDTVVWTNKDPFPHTATARGVFDSKEIDPGKSWKWTARRAGVYEYVCTLHPTMKGTITVK
jgi:plastocyanin